MDDGELADGRWPRHPGISCGTSGEVWVEWLGTKPAAKVGEGAYGREEECKLACMVSEWLVRGERGGGVLWGGVVDSRTALCSVGSR